MIGVREWVKVARDGTGDVEVDWGGPRGSGPIAMPVRESRDGNDLIDADGAVVYHANPLIASFEIDFASGDGHFVDIRTMRDILNRGGPRAESLKRWLRP